MKNADVARTFREIADLLEIKGEQVFRVNSYRRVARSVADLATDIADVAARGELAGLPGVGKASAAKIQEYLDTGQIAARQQLAQEMPESLLQLLEIQGLGPKKATLLWREVGVTSLEDLKNAITAGKLDTLKGFGKKSIDRIRAGIDFLARGAGRTRLGVAWPIAEELRETIILWPGVKRVEHAGSLRRGRETVGDLDLLCLADDGERIVKRFTELPMVQRVLAAGSTKGSVQIEDARGRPLQVDLRVVPEDSFGAAWQYFTGSKEHNVRLRERAVRRGWSLNEYGLSDGDTILASRTEQDIYAALELPWIPPELREDRGEFELDAVPPDLLTLDHIRGDIHMHTTASDGRCSIAEMVAAAKLCGYEYVCITEHSQASIIANGLEPDRLARHAAQVREIAKQTKGIAVWIGAEVDILADGRLDYADDVLAGLDFVVASVHSGMSKDRDANTRRTLAAIRNPFVNLIAHPTGRMIGKREAMPLDIEAVARQAARTGTALEINASTFRLDLKDTHARLARDLGALIGINTDAHHIDQLDQMRFGVWTARRAGLLKSDVLNTRSAREVRRFVKKKRKS
ncbi:MAG: DNA polymerase/3'-5' exonuclease PolX [Planctomycetes bacterium]|nr:DNA polymerase/3'-5' exonuclease PolX [Planctomycetota bacterium]